MLGIVFSKKHCSFQVKHMKNDSPGCLHSWGSQTQARVSWEEKRSVLSQRDDLCFPAEGRKQHSWDIHPGVAVLKATEVRNYQHYSYPCKKKKTPKNKKNTYYFTGLTLNKTLHIKLRTKYLQATICPWESSHAFGFTLYTLSILEMLAFVFIFIIFGITFPQTSANALTVKQQEVTFLKI